ncbi:unnamed protein product [Ambrosiozyma monospora]|uniref:Unnamed protein product n=1 Tax=Ambrosiozyma monospora TaxID=43982 RepID=A0ACB5U201_AMBMO|nr:unnamed protein product [Ambrosiozyma monospora]
MSTQHEFQQREHQQRVSKLTIQRKANKRRFNDGENEDNNNNFNNNRARNLVRARLPHRHSINMNNGRFKKQRNPEVFGQKLPLNRIIESLDKAALQKLLTTMITNNPQLTTDVMDASPNVTIENSLAILHEKLQLILDNMPYKVDPSSDYSFLRVKPYVDEFFQALSDYTLNFIPPVENDLTVCIQFLVEFLTQIFHKLPKFQAVEFRYYYKLTTEKFNHIFNDIVYQFVNDKKQNILLIINNNWLDNFKKLNELNNNEFHKVQFWFSC